MFEIGSLAFNLLSNISITVQQETKRPFTFAPAAPVAATATAPVAAVPKPAFRPAAAAVETAPAEQTAATFRQQETADQPEAEHMEQPALAVEMVAEDSAEAPAAPIFKERDPASAETPLAPPREIPTGALENRAPRSMPNYDDEHGKGFFSRVADVGRVLSSRGSRQEVEQRIQVVQKPVMQPSQSEAAEGEDEQYLDIPAFLRRQAN